MPIQTSLPDLFQRLRRLPARTPWLGAALRVTGWTALGLYFVLALLILALRHAVLPQIENYRGDIERAIGEAIQRPVGIRAIEAHWIGLRPTLDLQGVEIRDEAGRPALVLDEVEVELAWSSLWHFAPRLARLELDSPELVLRRDGAGRYFVAGLEITPQPEADAGFADWLLAQDRIVIRNARITWNDELRGAPPLELKQLHFQLDNRGSRHRFGLSALPPPALAARLDLRGDFRGRDIDQLAAWKGEAYAELDYADLAGWRAWVDYPVDLPRGSGALRLWLGFAQKRLMSATADLRLADVRLRLAPDLPELDLLRLDGRLAGKRLDGGFEIALQGLSLATRDGIELPATDVAVAWQAAAANRPAQGRAGASDLDLDLLARLAAHLPLDSGLRERLERHAPKGRIRDLDLEWKGNPGDRDSRPQWRVAGRFEDLGLRALGPVPGIAGVNGRIDGNEKGGSLRLDGHQARFDLPTVFAEPVLHLEAFAADLDWKGTPDGLRVNLQKASFHNKDAAGEASGTWRALPAGPGEIDLAARLTRGSGDAVWRYMPLAVGKDARDWLRTAIVGGTASEATLKLRGDLGKFPFRDGREGKFEVRGKFADARLRYAEGWPEITGIDGELLFEGVRMLITGKTARIFGVELRDVKAEIADLEIPEEILTVGGKAIGPTADFLRFIEASPVGNRIDHFTEDMTADGKGELDLKLVLPLRRMENATVNGAYRFDGNRLLVDADLPALTDVRGELRFTADMLEAKGIRASLLGTPLAVDVKTAEGGNVLVSAGGEVAVATLRRQFAHPVLDHLSGGARWSGTVRVRKKNAEVRIVSNLAGLSSSLPEPFSKTAAEAVPLVFERKAAPPRAAKVSPGGTAPAARDVVELSLGRALRAQVLRRENGAIAGGQVLLGAPLAASPAPPPDGTLALQADLPRVNVDFWRALLAGNGNDKGNGASGGAIPPLPALRFDLRSADLTLFDKHFHDLRISGARPAATGPATPAARFELKSRELAGQFEWHGAGAGKLVGRIAQFSLPETAASPDTLRAALREGAELKEMPALDITVEQLGYKGRSLGTVRVAAENREGDWNARLDMRNEDGSLEATGRWRPDRTAQETRVDFKLGAKNIEKLLTRVGVPDAVRRGTATLSGQLAWKGAPHGIDYPSLHGSLALEAAGGQFNKLEPGVGRLLGILSLQSLPRRITLDFRDIFSEGFAFDRIDGRFAVSGGVMETKDLQIQGPAAKVLMSGTVNLGNETQNLKVRVQPAVGESIAVGAMLANPVAGAVAWVAQKILKDPLDQAFAFEYAVTGAWADPKVEKTGQTQPPPAEEKKP